MTVILGAIADDFTGATDLANTLVRQGMRTVQLLDVPPPGTPVPDVDAEVVALQQLGKAEVTDYKAEGALEQLVAIAAAYRRSSWPMKPKRWSSRRGAHSGDGRHFQLKHNDDSQPAL